MEDTNSPQPRPPEELEIKTMSRSQLDFAIGLAAKEGWNPGLHDAYCFYTADPEGFFAGVLDGRPIGCISAVSYGGQYGFIGLYIVAPEHRGKGCGMALWRHATARLVGQTVGLDGVLAQQDNYRKSGFAYAYRNVRYVGSGWPAPIPDKSIRPLSALPRAEVFAYDARHFPADRGAFLNAWLSQEGSHSAGFVVDGRMAGYGVIRRCQTGWKIGPLFADSPKIARSLLLHLAANASPSDPVFLDVPEPNSAAVRLTSELGMTMVFETARMYLGAPPKADLAGTFGITTFELG